MAEPQYAPHFDLPREELGVMANSRWQRDPKLLGITLARYKFASKLLCGKKLVAEIGCGDGWFSRVVKHEVGELHLYDFDVALINDCMSRGGVAWFHDMLVSPLPHKYDGIYSLDVLEHIAYDKQDIFLSNICASLKPDTGVCIIGMPSLNSQQYASEVSKAGHIGCLTHAELKERMLGHFENVFILTINDEQIGLGYERMAHYYLAIGVGVI